MTTVSASSYLRSAIDARRLMKARRLLQRAQSNPFYAPRLAGCGVTADNLHSLDQWRDLPVVDKTSFLTDQEQRPPYGTRLGVDPSAIRQVHLTSGTSGFGQEAFALTDDDLDTAGALWRHAFDAMALAPGDLFVTFYPITFLAYGRSVLEGGRVTGVPIMSMAGLDRSAAVALMRRLQPAAIGARPALFGLLREELEADGLTARDAFPHLRAVVCSGLAPPAAAALEAEWGVTIHEVYGSSQAGGIAAATGPEGAVPGGEAGVMQVIEDHFLVEAVDPKTLEPVEEGEAELLLTCLDRVASPVIRFRTGDRVDVVPPGAYGDRTGPLGLRVGSVDRWDDMLKIRGNNVWPAQLNGALLGHGAVADYRADVFLDGRSVDVLVVRVRLKPGAQAAEDLDRELRRRVKRATNVTPQIEWAPDLPAPGLKPRRLTDRRKG